MKVRLLVLALFILSLLGTAVGFFLTNSIKFNLCTVNETITEASCINFYERLGDPLFYGFATLAIIFLVLLILPSAFRAWKKFAIWAVPILILIFATYEGPGSGDYFSPYAEQVFQWLSMLYVGLSLGIIAASLVSQRFVAQGKKPLHIMWYWGAAVILGYVTVSNTATLVSLLPF